MDDVIFCVEFFPADEIDPFIGAYEIDAGEGEVLSLTRHVVEAKNLLAAVE